MKRQLTECPRFKETELKDKQGQPVVNCSICEFGKKGGRMCDLPKRLRIVFDGGNR